MGCRVRHLLSKQLQLQTRFLRGTVNANATTRHRRIVNMTQGRFRWSSDVQCLNEMQRLSNLLRRWDSVFPRVQYHPWIIFRKSPLRIRDRLIFRPKTS